jgi:pyruvate kinase
MQVGNNEVTCTVLNDAILGSWKNLNLLGVRLNMPVLTSKDKQDLELLAQCEVDFLAVSFVQSKSDIEYIKEELSVLGASEVQIVAKIETVQALHELDGILEESDGVMIARGDLGTFITPEKVFLAQNLITTKANIQGKFVILARHCLQSMVSNPRPTRAEMTDVANAVLDGVHCVMLSAETAVGSFPVESVSTLAAIVRNAEAATNYIVQHNFIRDMTAKPFTKEEGVASVAAKSPMDGTCRMVVVLSETGRMANTIGKFKCPIPLLVVTSEKSVAAGAKINFAQYPYLVEVLGDRDGMADLVKQAVAFAKSEGLYSGGSIVVVHGANEPSAETEPVLQMWPEGILG